MVPRPLLSSELILYQVIQAMQPWKSSSLLRTFLLDDDHMVNSSPWSSARPVDSNDSHAGYEPQIFAEMLEGVRKLYHYTRSSSSSGEFQAAVKLFLHSLLNLRAGGHTTDELKKTRSTLRLYRTIKRETRANIGTGSPQFLATVVYFEVLQAYIIAQGMSIAIGFSAVHMQVVERIAGVLNNRYQNLIRKIPMEGTVNLGLGDLTRCMELLQWPLSVAADYRTRGNYVFVH